MVGDVCVLERLHFMSHYMRRNGISFKEVFINLRCISDMKAKKENNAHIHTACAAQNSNACPHFGLILGSQVLTGPDLC